MCDRLLKATESEIDGSRHRETGRFRHREILQRLVYREEDHSQDHKCGYHKSNLRNLLLLERSLYPRSDMLPPLEIPVCDVVQDMRVGSRVDHLPRGEPSSNITDSSVAFPIKGNSRARVGIAGGGTLAAAGTVKEKGPETGGRWRQNPVFRGGSSWWG